MLRKVLNPSLVSAAAIFAELHQCHIGSYLLIWSDGIQIAHYMLYNQCHKSVGQHRLLRNVSRWGNIQCRRILMATDLLLLLTR